MNKNTKTTPEFKRHKEAHVNVPAQMTEAEMIADAEMMAALAKIEVPLIELVFYGL